MSDAKLALLSVTDQITADIYKSLLESNDIPVFLRSDAAHSIHPFTIGILADVEVFVREEHLADATALIKDIEVTNDESTDFINDRNDAE